MRKADGSIEPRQGGKWKLLMRIFANPNLPEIDDYYANFRVNRDLPDAVKKAIAGKLPIVEVANHVSPLNFANPSCISRDPKTGELTGMNEVMTPWAGGAAQ